MCAVSTYLCLPLSPETSSSSEGGNSALGTNTSSCNYGYVLCFGKDFSKISHIWTWGRRMNSCSDTLMLTKEAIQTVLATSIQKWLLHAPARTSISKYHFFLSLCILDVDRHFLKGLKNMGANPVGQHVSNQGYTERWKDKSLKMKPSKSR